MKFIHKICLLALASSAVAQAEVILKPIDTNANPTPTATTAEQLDGKQEVAYLCEGGDKQKIPLTAMYGFKGDDVVVAQVRLAGTTSPGMWRVPDVLLNRFVSQDENVRPTMWTTMPANAHKIAHVDGGKLSFAENQGGVHTVIVENCKLDKAATAKLNR